MRTYFVVFFAVAVCSSLFESSSARSGSKTATLVVQAGAQHMEYSVHGTHMPCVQLCLRVTLGQLSLSHALQSFMQFVTRPVRSERVLVPLVVLSKAQQSLS